MKIYYELLEEEGILEETYQKTLEACPPEFLEGAEILTRMLIQTNKQYYIELMEKYKYQLMWVLRSLEPEIEEEKGAFIINKAGKIELRDFSPELTDKIAKVLGDSVG